MASPRSRGATGPHSAAFVSWCTLLSYPRGPSKHYGRGSVVLVRSRKSPRSTHPSNLASPLIRNCPAQHQESPKLWIPRPTPARGLKVTFFARMVCCYPCCRRFLPTCTRASHAATRNWHATRPLFQLRLPPGASHWALCYQLPKPDRQKVRAASRQSSHRVVGSARGSGKMQRAGRVLKSTLAPKPCSSAR